IRLLREKVPDVKKQGVIVLIVLLLCFTPALDVAAIVFFIGIVVLMRKSAKQAKRYGILSALLYNINPDRMAHSVVDESQLLPEEINDEDLDNYPELEPFNALYDETDQRFSEDSKRAEQAVFMNEFAMQRPGIEQLTQEYISKVQGMLRQCSDNVIALANKANAAYEELKAKYKGFGYEFNESGVFDTNFVFGRKDFIEEKMDIGTRNLIIRPGDDQALLDSFIRLLYVNAITHVNYMKLMVFIYDPNGMGRSVMPLYVSTLEACFRIMQDGLDELLSQLTVEAQKNFEIMRGSSILEYNNMCVQNERDTLTYKLLFVLSQPKTIEENEKLASLFQYSAESGILIWIVSDTMEATDKTYVFNKPFAGVANPVRDQDNRDWCRNVTKLYADFRKNYKPPSLDWSKFMTVCCPPDKQWSFNCDDNIYLYPGFTNGDPDLCDGYPIGNGGNVHCLGVGTTGAGKSIFIHHMIQTMCEMYSPQELQLWLCDFKGTEFKFYMKSETFPYSLPHIKACLCTSDGAFAMSLLHALRVETDKRFEQMKNPNDHLDWLNYNDGEPIPNTDNAKNWNRYWRDRAKERMDDRYLENCYPRAFLIADEFQVMFQVADTKCIDTITTDMTQISKLGRAANVSMFFVSQSMKGTLSADILNQFSLRFALRCTADVSMDIMGTPYAAENLPRFGGLYVSATGIKKENQPKVSTPGIDNETIHNSTKILAERAVNEKIKPYDLITYEESTKHPISELEELYDDLEKEGRLPNESLIVFGERMAYSENRAPDNAIVAKKNNENFMCCFSDYNDYVLFFNQMMVNLKRQKDKPMIIVNSQVEDLTYITNADSYITDMEKHGAYLYESCAKMTAWIKKVVESRQQSGKTSPIWIFLLGWDKGLGFGVDMDFNVKAGVSSILQTAGAYNIHIVMMNLSMMGVPLATVSACKYRVAGACTVDDSTSLIGTRQAGLTYEGMSNGWIFVNNAGVVTRDKLYISEIEREIAASTLVL
ncbi:MAG: FtsK/SpoIIIE domain-containing protein, partial [Roseburia sp.]|nr:FtsK/SpoIIIE domain-containing protein [Roseburia sp.]